MTLGKELGLSLNRSPLKRFLPTDQLPRSSRLWVQALTDRVGRRLLVSEMKLGRKGREERVVLIFWSDVIQSISDLLRESSRKICPRNKWVINKNNSRMIHGPLTNHTDRSLLVLSTLKGEYLKWYQVSPSARYSVLRRCICVNVYYDLRYIFFLFLSLSLTLSLSLYLFCLCPHPKKSYLLLSSGETPHRQIWL